MACVCGVWCLGKQYLVNYKFYNFEINVLNFPSLIISMYQLPQHFLRMLPHQRQTSSASNYGFKFCYYVPG